MAHPRLKLYVDTVSPFAYEAYYILRASLSLVDSDAATGKVRSGVVDENGV